MGTLKDFIRNYDGRFTDEEIIKGYIISHGLIGRFKGIMDDLAKEKFPDQHKGLITKADLIKDVESYRDDWSNYTDAYSMAQSIIGIIEDAEEWG